MTRLFNPYSIELCRIIRTSTEDARGWDASAAAPVREAIFSRMVKMRESMTIYYTLHLA